MAYDTTEVFSMKEIDLMDRGRAEGLELAAKHIEAQKVVWNNVPIPPGHLLDMLAKNIRALKEYK